MSNLNSDTFAIFAAFEKNIVKFSVKIPRRFDIIFLLGSILLYFIILQKLLKVLHKKIQKVILCVLRL